MIVEINWLQITLLRDRMFTFRIFNLASNCSKITFFLDESISEISKFMLSLKKISSNGRIYAKNKEKRVQTS
jgi:hypothetical protein